MIVKFGALLRNSIMAQRSITSFFSKGPSVSKAAAASKSPIKDKSPIKVSESNLDDSPIKATTKRKRIAIQSDSEDENVDVNSVKSSPAAKKVATEEKPASPVKSPKKETGKAKPASPKKSPKKSETKSPVKSPSSGFERKTADVKKYKGPGLLPGIAKALEAAKKRNDDLSKTFDALKNSPKKERKSSVGDEENSKTEVESKANEESKDVEKSKDNKKSKDDEQSDENNSSKSDEEPMDVEEIKNASKSEKSVKSSEKDTKGKGKTHKAKTPKTKTTSAKKGTKTKAENAKRRKPGETIAEKENRIKKEAASKSSDEDEGKEKKSKTDDENESSEDESKKKKSSKNLNSFFGSKKGADGSKTSPKSKAANAPKTSPKGKGATLTSTAKVPGSDYNPAKEKYHPIEDATWKRNEKVPYLALACTLTAIEDVSARLKIISILANYFRSVIALTPEDLLPSIYMCLNQLGPAYAGIEMGVAESYLMKAIAQCTGRTVAQIKTDAAECGDLGVVAEQSRSNQRMMFQPAPLTVSAVFKKRKEIAAMTGTAAVSKKIDKIQSMFVACRHVEARFLIRSFTGKLRIGLAEQSVLQALASACVNTPPGQDYPPATLSVAKSMSAESFKELVDEEAQILKTTYCECPNYDMIVPVILKHGIKALPDHCKLTPGIPLKPMLAQPTKGASEVLTRFEGLKFTCEWKYDGERAQIHLEENGTISIYSRNQENNTSKYPDIISRLKSALGPDVKSCVLDTESVAWDRENKKIMPFQVLSTRKKKDANEADIKVQVCVFMFDLLYLNGTPLIREPLLERRRLLKENFKEVEEQFLFAISIDPSLLEEVQEFLEESVKGNCEGLMVKTLEDNATYEIAKRSRNWLKLKKDYLDGCGDTLDVVVLGGYLGRGKRTGVYGGFLLGCYDSENEEYQSICKIGTGFTDEMLVKHSEFFKEHLIKEPKSYYRYDSSLEPDHWFDAVQVWEIKCADLSLSPIHHAAIGIVDPEKGISLRFPRFLRIRDDKSVEEATSAQQVADLYKNQDQIKNQEGQNKKISEEDFY